MAPAKTLEAIAAADRTQSLLLLSRVARVARRRFELAIAPLGLRPRHMVALAILRDDGPLTQGALGDALCLDPANVVGLLNELEERSLLERRRDPDDRRRHIVELSRRGATTLARAEDALVSVQDGIFSALDDGERATLHALLLRVTEAQLADCPDTADGGPCADATASPCADDVTA